MRKLNYLFRYLFSDRKKRLLLKYNGSEFNSTGIPVDDKLMREFTIRRVKNVLRQLYDNTYFFAYKENDEIRAIHRNDEFGFSFSFVFSLLGDSRNIVCYRMKKDIESRGFITSVYFNGYKRRDGLLEMYVESIVSFIIDGSILRFPLRLEIDYDISTSTCETSIIKPNNLLK